MPFLFIDEEMITQTQAVGVLAVAVALCLFAGGAVTNECETMELKTPTGDTAVMHHEPAESILVWKKGLAKSWLNIEVVETNKIMVSPTMFYYELEFRLRGKKHP